MKTRTIFFIFFIVGPSINGINLISADESTSASVEPMIVGGENTTIKDAPFQVVIRVQNKYAGTGCIVSPKHILTTAKSCSKGNKHVPLTDITVHTGTTQSEGNGNSHVVVKITLHPEWDESSMINDVAVIEVKEKINFDLEEKKIELATQDVVSRQQGILTGWGRTEVNNPRNSHQLLKLNVTLLSTTDCQQYQPMKLDAKQMCAYQQKGHGGCLGDSGAPLVVNNQVIGLFSYIIQGGCATGSAEIFTNVYAQKSFIEPLIIET